MRFVNLRLLALFVAVLLLSSFEISAQSGRTPQATPTPKEDDVERVDTEEVKLNVMAFDNNGNVAPDVTVSDLVITENDILHQPSSVRRIPAHVLIVMDTGGDMRQVKSLDETKRIARAVVAALKPEDAIAIMEYNNAAEITADWTTDRELIDGAIRRANFGRGSAFAEALDIATDYFLKDSLENKHLVLITDGTDGSSTPQPKKDAMRRLQTTAVSVHVLSYTMMEAQDIAPRTNRIQKGPPRQALPDEVQATLPNGVRDRGAVSTKSINMDRTLIRKLKARKTDLENSEKQLETLAENTNGTAVIPETLDEMVEKTAWIAKMIDATYAVTYMPKVPIKTQNGIGQRRIEVTSKRAGLHVQARRKLIIDRNN